RVGPGVARRNGPTLVPQRSVSDLQGIYNVAVVGADDTIELRMVKPAQRIGTLWVIDSGLKAGERVVAEGMQKVRAGVKVKPGMVKIEKGNSAPRGAPAGGAAAEAKGAKG